MIFLDTNIIIYAFKPEYQYILDVLEVKSDKLAYSEMVRLEVMGFSGFDRDILRKTEDFFANMIAFQMDDRIIDEAIKLRQQKAIGAPDAIIAATALVHKSELWTSNEKDFSWIKDLKWHNPIQLES